LSRLVADDLYESTNMVEVLNRRKHRSTRDIAVLLMQFVMLALSACSVYNFSTQMHTKLTVQFAICMMIFSGFMYYLAKYSDIRSNALILCFQASMVSLSYYAADLSAIRGMQQECEFTDFKAELEPKILRAVQAGSPLSKSKFEYHLGKYVYIIISGEVSDTESYQQLRDNLRREFKSNSRDDYVLIWDIAVLEEKRNIKIEEHSSEFMKEPT